MTEVYSRTKKNTDPWVTLIGSSILITLFLFFIDEGYYNFKWMASIGNWIPFFIYSLLIFVGQLFVYAVLLNKYQGRGKVQLSVFGGTALGILFAITVIFTNW